jgi:hypothetical protein
MNRLNGFVLFAATAAAQSYPAAWKLAHPDAKALIGIDLRSLRESRTAQSLDGDIQQAGIGMVKVPGMDLLKEIDRIFISSPGGKTANPKEDTPFLIVVTGHFAPDHVRELLHGPHRTYATVDIYGSPEAANMSMARLDEGTLILGDEASLHGAIDRRNQARSTPDALLVRASTMAAHHDFWLIATMPPSAFQPANMNLGRFATEIQGIDLGFSLRDGFQLELGLATKAPDTAREITELISTQLKSALASNLDEQQGADIIRKLEINSDGARVGAKIALNKEEVDRMVRTARAARQNTPPPKPTPPPPDKPNTIRIFGLDDGVREIPVGPNTRH